MSSQPSQDSAAEVTVPSIPDDCASAETKLVYLYLSLQHGATIDELNDDLGIKKLSLFPALETLDGHGLLTQDGPRYRLAT